jgi:hypothetical protein
VGEGRIYPAVGGNAFTGHALMLLTPDVWRTDVFAFLEARVPPIRPASARAGETRVK